MRRVKIHLIAAARPNFMKVAPLYHALKGEKWCCPMIVHTGQHYDPEMSDSFFADLNLPQPDFSLEVGSGTHAEQTAGVMVAYEKVCLTQRTDWVIVVGDVNSTMACAITAKKLCIPVAHLEAGLRSRDMSMPEEINRLVTDAISDILWTPSPDADENLLKEGVAPGKIVRVGNIMIDSYEIMREQIEADPIIETLKLPHHGYGVITLHRPVNVDDENTLKSLINVLIEASKIMPLIFPVHPRTRHSMEKYKLLDAVNDATGLYVGEPMGYISFMCLVSKSKFVISDSGGIQEETTYLNIPCLTLRSNTERPITLTHGTNKLVDQHTLLDNIDNIIKGKWKHGARPDFWDGHTASRVVKSLRMMVPK